MNAFLNDSLIGYGNSIAPGLRTDVAMDSSQLVNFMTPSFQTAGITSPFTNIFDSVPYYNGNSNIFNSVAASNSFASSPEESLKQLLNKGIISKEEYTNKLRELNGFSSEGSNTATLDANGQLAELSDKETEKARKSGTGNYKVTETHTEIAKQYVEAAKEALKAGDATTVSEIFEEVNKNPMLADAFIQKANKEKFTSAEGKTTTLLGSYEQALTNSKGQKAAKEEMKEVKEKFSKNVKNRNSNAFGEFEKQYSEDSSNVEYSLKAKAINNPGKVLGYTIAGAAATKIAYSNLGGKQVLGAAGKAIGKLSGKAALPAGKVLGRLGKWGALAALAYGTYKLCTAETK